MRTATAPKFPGQEPSQVTDHSRRRLGRHDLGIKEEERVIPEVQPKAESALAAAVNDQLVVTGINQHVEVLGRDFHVQTEFSGQKVRCEVFLGGRVVATRCKDLSAGDLAQGAAAIRKFLKSLHLSVVSRLETRAKTHGRDPVDAPCDPKRSRSEARAQNMSTEDDTPLDPARVERSLAVRGLYEQLWSQLEQAAEITAWPERLEVARDAFAGLRASPVFSDVRIDEQALLQGLQQDVGGWLESDRDPREATEIWKAIQSMWCHTVAINQRRELIAYDRRRSDQPQSFDDNSEIQGASGSQPGSRLQSSASRLQEKLRMAKFNLDPLASIDGFIGTCLVDSGSGMMLGASGGGNVNLEVAAAGNTEVVRAKRKTMNSLKLNDQIEDILISLGKHYHIIRPLESANALFLYLVLDREKSNLAMARHELKSFEGTLDLS